MCRDELRESFSHLSLCQDEKYLKDKTSISFYPWRYGTNGKRICHMVFLQMNSYMAHEDTSIRIYLSLSFFFVGRRCFKERDPFIWRVLYNQDQTQPRSQKRTYCLFNPPSLSVENKFTKYITNRDPGMLRMR